jgi:DNA polymerase III beta subunit, central domain
LPHRDIGDHPIDEVSGELTHTPAALQQTSFAIPHDENRYALNGVLFTLQANQARLVATDGHRLAVSTRGLGAPATAVTGIVPRKAVELPAAALTMKAGDNATISLRCGGVSYRLMGLPPDDFPPVVPASPSTWIPIEARALRAMNTEGQKPRPLQLKATTMSSPQRSQRTCRHPCSSTPQRRKAWNSRETKAGSAPRSSPAAPVRNVSRWASSARYRGDTWGWQR